ncbi:MAG: four helix bundle protein [Caldilineaceae bacterium]|nr:four helix bundle protein [Caldilineaceae bacterium]
MNESPIFARVQDLLRWLLPATRKFPREYRFTLAQEVTRHGFALQEALVAAGLDRRQAPAHLLRADMALTNLRKLLLLCYELELLSAGQFRHVSQMTAEVGRLLGGWRKSAGER